MVWVGTVLPAALGRWGHWRSVIDRSDHRDPQQQLRRCDANSWRQGLPVPPLPANRVIQIAFGAGIALSASCQP